MGVADAKEVCAGVGLRQRLLRFLSLHHAMKPALVAQFWVVQHGFDGSKEVDLQAGSRRVGHGDRGGKMNGANWGTGGGGAQHMGFGTISDRLSCWLVPGLPGELLIRRKLLLAAAPLAAALLGPEEFGSQLSELCVPRQDARPTHAMECVQVCCQERKSRQRWPTGFSLFGVVVVPESMLLLLPKLLRPLPVAERPREAGRLPLLQTESMEMRKVRLRSTVGAKSSQCWRLRL